MEDLKDQEVQDTSTDAVRDVGALAVLDEKFVLPDSVREEACRSWIEWVDTLIDDGQAKPVFVQRGVAGDHEPQAYELTRHGDVRSALRIDRLARLRSGDKIEFGVAFSLIAVAGSLRGEKHPFARHVYHGQTVVPNDSSQIPQPMSEADFQTILSLPLQAEVY